jgi:hypothetical protein
MPATPPPQGDAGRAFDGALLTGPSFDAWPHCTIFKLAQGNAEAGF